MESPMFSMKNRKVANYFINPRFQFTFILSNLALALIVIAVLFVANQIFFQVFEQKGLSLGLPANHVFFKFLESQQATMQTIFLVTAVVVFLLIFIQGVRFSHRIAGPLYRLSQDMNAIAKSQTLRKIQFRKGDYFLELPEAFNQMVDGINESTNKK